MIAKAAAASCQSNEGSATGMLSHLLSRVSIHSAFGPSRGQTTLNVQVHQPSRAEPEKVNPSAYVTRGNPDGLSEPGRPTQVAAAALADDEG
jgi:hypothetical protein